MAARKLIVFEHASAMGNAPAHKLFEAVKVERVGDDDSPARSFADYKVSVASDAVPAEVTVRELL
jgi:CRISPR-associated protein Csd2